MVAAQGRVFRQEKIKLDEFGSVATTIELDRFAPLGTYRVHLYRKGGPSFQGEFIVQQYKLEKVKDGDIRGDVCASGLDQSAIREAPAVIVICAVYERTSVKYGGRAERYVHMEVGHAGQNVHLQAVSLGLATVVIGAFRDDAVRQALALPPDEHPLYIMPVGRPRAR